MIDQYDPSEITKLGVPTTHYDSFRESLPLQLSKPAAPVGRFQVRSGSGSNSVGSIEPADPIEPAEYRQNLELRFLES